MDNVICPNCGADNQTNSMYCKQCGKELPKQEVENNRTQVRQLPTSASDGKKKLLRNVVFIIVFGLAYWGVQQIFFSPPLFDDLMMQVASELNKTCPIMVDQETRLDNTAALPQNSFQYNYTLVNLTKTEVNVDEFKQYVEPVIINQVKTNPDMKAFRDNRTTIIYSYKDKNGEFVYKFSVTAGLYE